MSEQGVYMDVDAVTGMAERFQQIGDVMKAVSKALEIAIMTLRVTAFVGLVGGAAVERYLSRIKPQVDKLSEKCSELHLDLIGAVVSYRDGDSSGSKRFQ
jgi:hypothetical protein